METYTLLRHFADSWALLALTLFFAGAVLWVFRPGSRAHHDEAAAIPLREAAPDDIDTAARAAAGARPADTGARK